MRIRNLTRTGIILALGTERLYLEPTRKSAIVRWTQRRIGDRHIEFGRFPYQCLQVPILEDIAHVEGIPDPGFPFTLFLVDQHVSLTAIAQIFLPTMTRWTIAMGTLSLGIWLGNEWVGSNRAGVRGPALFWLSRRLGVWHTAENIPNCTGAGLLINAGLEYGAGVITVTFFGCIGIPFLSAFFIFSGFCTFSAEKLSL